MTNEQIIIDKVNVSGCEYLYTDSKYNDKCCSASIGGDCLCKPSEMLCVKYVEHLKEQLKRKEQECEHWKKANDEKNELLIKLGCPTKATAKRMVFCLQEQLDKLKAENDLYKNAHKTEQDRRRSYENALAEIKEICNSVENIENINSLYDAKLSGMYLQAHKILQKISECEI